MQKENGITLVELLIVVVIVGILAAVSVPIYTNYMIRARRSDAKTALEQVRAAQEMWKAEKGTYTTDEAALQTTMGAPPSTISSYYTWDFAAASATAFTAQAVPTGSQTDDGTLTIDETGEKLPVEKWAK